jgi:catalase (peroxidase I)
MILFEKFGQHQPLNRQAERYAKEGVPLSLSTLVVGAGCAALERISDVWKAACRVGGDVAIPAPHRPGRADYPHPVLHA